MRTVSLMSLMGLLGSPRLYSKNVFIRYTHQTQTSSSCEVKGGEHSGGREDGLVVWCVVMCCYADKVGGGYENKVCQLEAIIFASKLCAQRLHLCGETIV